MAASCLDVGKGRSGKAVELLRTGTIQVGDLEGGRPAIAAEVVHHRHRVVLAQRRGVVERLVWTHRRGPGANVLVPEAEDVAELVPQDADAVKGQRRLEKRRVDDHEAALGR